MSYGPLSSIPQPKSAIAAAGLPKPVGYQLPAAIPTSVADRGGPAPIADHHNRSHTL